MHAFIVEGDNKVGELARLTEGIAKHGVNITSCAVATCGDMGSVCLTGHDEAATRKALGDSGFKFREIEAVEAGLVDQPGTLAMACRRLADQGVNIEAILPIGTAGSRISVAFVTSDPALARKALAEFAPSHA